VPFDVRAMFLVLISMIIKRAEVKFSPEKARTLDFLLCIFSLFHALNFLQRRNSKKANFPPANCLFKGVTRIVFDSLQIQCEQFGKEQMFLKAIKFCRKCLSRGIGKNVEWVGSGGGT
jgi:hypothetical protein